jgi:hypothetical protein
VCRLFCSIALLGVGLTASGAPPKVSFTSPLAFPFQYPHGMAAGDFNGDGKTDLAVLGDHLSVSIFIGKGDGTFRAGHTYKGPANSRQIVTGDFNGDGILDLVVTAYNTQPMIFLGNGDGSFQPGVSFAADITWATVGDFNGDGKLDLAGTNNYGSVYGEVSIILGNGDGTFQPPTTLAVGTNPDLIAVADFNGDGALDLAVTDFKSPNVWILLGQGDGTFRAPVGYPLPFYFGNVQVTVVAGNFTASGNQDLAIGTALGIAILIGAGDGTFSPGASYPGYAAGYGMAALVKDGDVDLAVFNDTSDQPPGISVLAGNGDGTFQPAVSYTGIGPPAGPPVVADFNGDGYPDVAVACEYPGPRTGSVMVLLGGAAGFPTTLTAAVNASSQSSGATIRDAVADFNGDGKLDLAVSQGGTDIQISLGNGDGTFQPGVLYSVPEDVRTISMGDFNGDGTLDLAIGEKRDQLTILLGNGDGTFHAGATQMLPSNPTAAVTGDFNGDGKLDLVLVAPGQGARQGLWLLLGNGDGTFQPPVELYSRYPRFDRVVAADFNGDGVLDLAIDGPIIFLGNGDGTFRQGASYDAGPAEFLLTADFNGDGIPDLASGANILLGNGDGTFRPSGCCSLPMIPNEGAVGDFNGHGNLDIALTFGQPNLIGILVGNGDGTFSLSPYFGAGWGPRALVAGAFSGGMPDLLFLDQFGPSGLQVLMNATR